jgi:hypothetical protein
MKLEAGVRIELTLGVLQAKNGGFSLFPPLANLALNTLIDSHLRDFCKTVNIVKHRVTLSKVSITASITEVSRTDCLGSSCDGLQCLGIRFYPRYETDSLGLFQKVLRAHVAVGAGDDGRAALVSNQCGDLRVRQSRFPALRHEETSQPVECHVAHSGRATQAA